MLFPLLALLCTQVQCGTVEKEELASSLDFLPQVLGGLGEPLTAAGLQSGLKFPSVLACLQRDLGPLL